MSCGVTHVVLTVVDPARSAEFYRRGADFEELPGSGTRELDGRGVVLRLVPGTPQPGVTLRLQTTDIESLADRLVGAGAHWLRAPENVGTERTALLADPDGHRLELWRRLRESELAVPPELPTSLPWAAAARDRAHWLLSLVPEEFRDLARRGLVAEAEFLGAAEAEIGPELALRAYVRSTPRMLRARLRGPLEDLGLDLRPLAEDFEC